MGWGKSRFWVAQFGGLFSVWAPAGPPVGGHAVCPGAGMPPLGLVRGLAGPESLPPLGSQRIGNPLRALAGPRKARGLALVVGSG